MRGHEDEVTTAVFTADGSKVLSSSKDGTLRLWDAHTGAPLAVLQSGEGVVDDVAMSRDGKIATLSKDEVVQVFECEVCGEPRGRARARASPARRVSSRPTSGGSYSRRRPEPSASSRSAGSTTRSKRRRRRPVEAACVPPGPRRFEVRRPG